MQLLSSTSVGCAEANQIVKVLPRRPDWHQVLHCIVEEHVQKGRPGHIGAFVGGPAGMVGAVEAACLLSCKRAQGVVCPIDVHRHTFEL